MQLLGMDGKVILEKSISPMEREIAINMSDFPAGQFLLEVIKTNNKAHFKSELIQKK